MEGSRKKRESVENTNNTQPQYDYIVEQLKEINQRLDTAESTPSKKKGFNPSACLPWVGIVGLTIGAIIFFVNFRNDFDDMVEDNKLLATKNDYIQIAEKLDALEIRIQTVEQDGLYKLVSLGEDSISEVKVENNSRELHMVQLNWKADTPIGVNNQYLAKELVNQQVLATYTDGELDCVFYGRYNEKYQWDGNCLINAYDSAGELQYVMEAVYDNGKLLRYRNVFSDVSNQKNDIWIVSDRISTEGVNVGQTWNYYRDVKCERDFEMDSVNPNCLIYVSDFKEQLEGKLEAYYSGNTSNGRYNDDTGRAYLVKFDRDGTVITLYMGKFSDGKYNDHSGDAWLIARNLETHSCYMYTRGTFINNQCSKKDGNVIKFVHNLSQEQINEYLKGYVFNCELKWYFKESDAF